jgi:hypothetical protein
MIAQAPANGTSTHTLKLLLSGINISVFLEYRLLELYYVSFSTNHMFKEMVKRYERSVLSVGGKKAKNTDQSIYTIYSLGSMPKHRVV